jgi:hypothetical protein
VRSNGKLLRFALAPALLALVSGCGGINASKSVSPIDFLLPGGLLQAAPPSAQPDRVLPAQEPVAQIAQN